MSLIGHTILSASIEMLVKKLASEGFLLFQRQQQIRADLNTWQDTLVMIKAVLRDAEVKQMEDESVKIWLGKLENLAYDVEDMLDEFETEALRRKLLLEVDPAKPSTSKFRRIIPSCCTRFTPQSILCDNKMISKIKEITARFEEIGKQKERLGFEKILRGNLKKVGQRRDTTSLVNEAKVYGREKEKEEIVELLLRDDLGAENGLLVIPITGMGGVGKTTLAQLVYNDDRVQDHFDLKAWTCVSEDFDVIRITKAILKSISTNQHIDDIELNLLQEKLKKQLLRKRFLLVLDDVWNENYNVWSDFCDPIEASAPGSKILVTTRNQGVGLMMGTIPAYPLKELSNEDCLRVFTQHSLGTANFNMHQSLKEIGEKIVMKCDGLPLAAKTLGGLLRGKYDLSDWKDVLNSNIWNLSEEKCDIIPALRVSYHYLSPHLKRCFTYCSLFPKDYEFEEDEIILLWMAEGLLHHENREEQMENLGHKFFSELVSRSFLQQSSSHESRFVMHDLINDLARWAAGEICYRMEGMFEGNRQQRFSKNLHHFSYIRGILDGSIRFKALDDVKQLRTFLAVALSNQRDHSYLACSVLDMLMKFPRLRVLCLSGYRIVELPNSIGDLKHLRHLNLSETEIRTLPESVNTLYNLETLLLKDCHQLKKLCPDLGNLTKLLHLNNCNTNSLKEMPRGIGKLTCLQTLYRFVVGKDTGCGLQELKSLTHLQGTLEISRLENVKDVDDAKEAQLNQKRNLTMLLLQWAGRTTDNSREPESETRVLDLLKPHQNLTKLIIRGFGGKRFPIWLGDSSLSNLVLLRFEGCHMCTSLPSLGQLPFLKHLYICKVYRVKSVGLEFYGKCCLMSFPSLESLHFQEMQDWEDWITHEPGEEVEAFPKLQQLSLVSCSKLQGILPQRLSSLERLHIERCEQLLVSISSLPSLRELNIDGCKKVVWRSPIDLSSLNSVVLKNMIDQVVLSGLLENELPKLEELKVNNTGELTYLWQSGTQLLQGVSSLCELTIKDCPELLSLVAEEEHDQLQQGLSSRLQYVEFSRCEVLVKVPKALLSLSSLGELNVIKCNSLVSFPEAVLPSQLRKILIDRCNALKSLPEAWMYNTNASLESLTICSCNSLTYIARVQLPPSLKQLWISFCDNLRTVVDEDRISAINKGDGHSVSIRNTALLEDLYIYTCPSLVSLFSENELPATLETIRVIECPRYSLLSPRRNLPKALKYLEVSFASKLESIAARFEDDSSLETLNLCHCDNLKLLPDGLHKLGHLQRISISGCPELVSFPEGGLPSMELTELSIDRCEKLEALPNDLHIVTSLQHLKIEGCPSLLPFPEDVFPTSLASLTVHNGKICKQILKWGLNRFTSLRKLRIGGCPEMVSFAPEGRGPALPASLTQLEIVNFPSLERLSSSLCQNLTSLECLILIDCPKLKHFPETGLPASLLQLCINRCPLIQERCRKDGDYWHLMTHIPYVQINFRWVFNY